MIPHGIRLRHPWEEIPAAMGRAMFRRRFNRPTGLDPWERVALEIDRTPYSGEVSLNGRALGKIQRGEFFAVDITKLLEPANELIVDVEARSAEHAADQPPPPSHSPYIVEADEPLGSPIGDVRLVIRAMHAEPVEPAPSPQPSPEGRGS